MTVIQSALVLEEKQSSTHLPLNICPTSIPSIFPHFGPLDTLDTLGFMIVDRVSMIFILDFFSSFTLGLLVVGWFSAVPIPAGSNKSSSSFIDTFSLQWMITMNDILEGGLELALTLLALYHWESRNCSTWQHVDNWSQETRKQEYEMVVVVGGSKKGWGKVLKFSGKNARLKPASTASAEIIHMAHSESYVIDIHFWRTMSERLGSRYTVWLNQQPCPNRIQPDLSRRQFVRNKAGATDLENTTHQCCLDWVQSVRSAAPLSRPPKDHQNPKSCVQAYSTNISSAAPRRSEPQHRLPHRRSKRRRPKEAGKAARSPYKHHLKQPSHKWHTFVDQIPPGHLPRV